MTVGRTFLFSAAYAGGAAIATCGGVVAMLSREVSSVGVTLAMMGIGIVSIASVMQGLELAAKTRAAAEHNQ